MGRKFITNEQIDRIARHLLSEDRGSYMDIGNSVGCSTTIVCNVAAKLMREGKLNKPKLGAPRRDPERIRLRRIELLKDPNYDPIGADKDQLIASLQAKVNSLSETVKNNETIIEELLATNNKLREGLPSVLARKRQRT